MVERMVLREWDKERRIIGKELVQPICHFQLAGQSVHRAKWTHTQTRMDGRTITIEYVNGQSN